MPNFLCASVSRSSNYVLKWVVCSLFAFSVFCSCQQAAVPTKPKPTNPTPATVLVRGVVTPARDTTKIIKGFEVVFIHRVRGLSLEQIVDDKMPASGHYQVRLLPGETYWARLVLKARDCEAEVQEITVPKLTASSVWIKNFTLANPDSTQYGGCLAGWRP